MKFLSKIQIKIKAMLLLCGAGLFFIANISYANTIIIHPNTVISFPKTYDGATLDMSNGSFIIKNHATLTIQNSSVYGTISESNPVLISVEDGNVNLNNNQVSITASGITQHPLTQSLQHVIQLALGNVNIAGNSFSIDQPFSAGFLITTSSIPTTGLQITNNTFSQFHGVLYLIASDNALVSDNIFKNNTYGNIVNIGNNSKIVHNTIAFSGNNRLGNSIDVIDSDNVLISKNILLTPTCHGVYVINSHHLTIDSNRIYGGITHAMTILTYPETSATLPGAKGMHLEYLTNILAQHKMRNSLSSTITVSNNFMSQNRYGLAGMDIAGLTVQNNTFIQRFSDDASRKFWTNNNILLKNVTGLSWTNNLYKEAYSQTMGSHNPNTTIIVPFPASGGITL